MSMANVKCLSMARQLTSYETHDKEAGIIDTGSGRNTERPVDKDRCVEVPQVRFRTFSRIPPKWYRKYRPNEQCVECVMILSSDAPESLRTDETPAEARTKASVSPDCP